MTATTLPYPGGTIRVLDEGPHDREDGPPVLLLHGSFASANAWRRVTEHLTPSHRVIAPDLAGYGQTTAPDGIAPVERHVAVVRAVAQHVGEPVHLVGHSAGAVIALAAAVRDAADLASLILIDITAAHTLTLTGNHAAAAEIRQVFEAYRDDHAAADPQAAATVIDFWGGPGAYAGLPDRVKQVVAESTALNFLDWQMIWEEQTPAAAYRGVTTPTLVLKGAASTPPLAALAAATRTLLPNTTYAEIPDASHFSISTHPADVAALIAGHVTDKS